MDKYIIDRVLDAARIEDVVTDCIGTYSHDNPSGLKKVGVRYTAICPFHEDRHMGNFIVYPRGNCFKCFTCDAKGSAATFLMKYEGLTFIEAVRWLGKKYGIETDNMPINYIPPPPRPTPPPLPTLVLPDRFIESKMRTADDNNLVKWVRSINWDSAQQARINEALQAYRIGHAKNGMTIFWQIDTEGKARTGKMMLYYPLDHEKAGHRNKEARYNFDFIHSVLSRHKDEHGETTYDPPYPYPHLFNPDKQEVRQCLFGLHLLNAYTQHNIAQEVRIVESEKTALLMAIAYGNHTKQVWMACGGVENLTRERLKPILDQGRHIILYPDRDGIDRWRNRVASLKYDNITIDTDPVTKWWKPEDGEKADIADVVVRMIQNKRIYKTVEEVIEDIPQLQILKDKLDIELIPDNDRRTETEGQRLRDGID